MLVHVYTGTTKATKGAEQNIEQNRSRADRRVEEEQSSSQSRRGAKQIIEQKKKRGEDHRVVKQRRGANSRPFASQDKKQNALTCGFISIY